MRKKRTQLCSVAQLSERFGIKASTFYYWAHIGRLKPACPPPEPLLFTLSALRVAVRQSRTKQPLGWYLKLGILLAMRPLITLSHEFTAQLHQAILAQIACPFDKVVYDCQVRVLQARYQSQEMVRLAVARCEGGA